MAENGYARNVAGDEVALWRLAVELQQQRIVSGIRAPADLLSATPPRLTYGFTRSPCAT